MLTVEFTYEPATASSGTVFHNLVLQRVIPPPLKAPTSERYNDSELLVAVGAAVVLLGRSEGLNEVDALERLREAGRLALSPPVETEHDDDSDWDAPFV